MNKLNLFCPINGTGYGITSANIGLQLNELNLDVSLFVLGQGVMLPDPRERDVMLKMLNSSRSYDPNAPCLKIWHQHDWVQELELEIIMYFLSLKLISYMILKSGV